MNTYKCSFKKMYIMHIKGPYTLCKPRRSLLIESTLFYVDKEQTSFNRFSYVREKIEIYSYLTLIVKNTTYIFAYEVT